MGRYTTVQSYTDNNPNMRVVSYDQATGGANQNNTNATPAAAPRPDKVFNPYGSTAGAGSSEFHVYRHARTREMVRLAQLDEEKNKKIENEEFEKKMNEWKVEEQTRTEKNRKKRKRQKLAKERKKNMKLAGVLTGNEESYDIEHPHTNKNDEDEFEYIPLAKQKESEKNETEKSSEDDKIEANLPFANDGSFLEMMKRKLKEEQENKNATVEDAKVSISNIKDDNDP